MDLAGVLLLGCDPERKQLPIFGMVGTLNVAFLQGTVDGSSWQVSPLPVKDQSTKTGFMCARRAKAYVLRCVRRTAKNF